MDERQLTRVLVEFARTLTGDFSIQKILDHLVTRVAEVIPVDGAGVLLMDSDTEHHFVAASDDAIMAVETLQTELQEGPCLQAYRTGEHVAVRDLSTDTVFTQFSPAAAKAGLSAVYSFPLCLNERRLGALELYAKEPVELSGEDLLGAQTLADVTAAYLDNARAREAATDLARTSAELAATLQESLLPPELPHVPGLAVAARFLPGRGGTLVGGDFYDVFPLPARRWGLLIGDVVGHGARAATLATLARYTVRTLAVLHHSPSHVLSGLNTTVLDRGEPERFLTAVYLTSRSTRHEVEVTIARGGHPPPLLRHGDGTIEALEIPGRLLGHHRDPGLTDVHLLLNRGDMLVLHTDGVTEARDDQDQFGDARLQALLATSAPTPATVTDDIIAAVLDHSHGILADDVAVLAMMAS